MVENSHLLMRALTPKRDGDVALGCGGEERPSVLAEEAGTIVEESKRELGTAFEIAEILRNSTRR